MTVYLDTVTINGLPLFDARPLFGPDGYRPRNPSLVKTISIHHADTIALPADATMDAEVARLQQIDRFHRQTRGWPGIAYSAVVFASSRTYLTGDYHKTRYLVGGDGNLETVGVCLDGNFMVTPPPSLQQYTAARVVEALRGEFPNDLTVVPHKHYGGTSCPGDTWDDWKDAFTLPPLDQRSPEQVQLDVLWGLVQRMDDDDRAAGEAAIIALKDHLGLP